MKREVMRLVSNRIYMFMLIIAPLVCYIFFADLLKTGVPNSLPAALVDKDNSSVSRALARSLDAFGQTKIVLRTDDFEEAREAMQSGKIYSIFYIPENFKQDASSGKEPLLSFYTNDSYLLPGSLLYKDMRLQAALANGVVQQTLLLAKGESEPELSAKLNPVVVDTHPLNNPWLSYSIYLTNTLIPAIFAMFVMFVTVYSISSELKRGTAGELMKMSHNSIGTAIIGKLIPQFIILFIMGSLYLVLLYRFLRFPINSGLGPMFLAMTLLILSCQALALFATGLVNQHRISLSFCALWSVLSFSIIGFTFPLRSMPEPLQWAANLFPMRHYFMIYVDQALNGIPMYYSWISYTALALFMFLPLLTLGRLKKQLLANRYIP